MLVHGVGRVPCDIAVIGEGPGWEEDRDGSPFVGKTGKELNRFLEDLGFSRRDVFLTNIYRRYGGKKYIWTEEDLREAEPFLLKELKRGRPRIIITLGRYATRYFLGDVDMDSTDKIAWWLPDTFKHAHIFKTRPVVFPIVHPAAGFHNPEQAAHTVAGFQELSRYLAGDMEPRELFDDPIKDPHYEEITTVGRLDDILRARERSANGLPVSTGMRVSRRRKNVPVSNRKPARRSQQQFVYVGIDTEGWPWSPWSLQFSFTAGTGFLIHRDSTAVLAAFSKALREHRWRIVFHSALHDLDMGRVLGVDFDGLEFDDTMVMAYLLQIVPKGLKQATLRECGMRMEEFGEIVAEPAERLALDYLLWLFDMEEVRYHERQERVFWQRKTEVWTDKKGKVHEGRRITKLPSLPKTALHKAVGRCIGSKRPRQLWEDQVDDIQVEGYNRLGPIPEASLDFVPRGRAVSYGSRDADGTIRLRDRYGARLDAMGLREVYNLELATYPLLNRMQRVGMRPDLEQFADLSVALGLEIDEVGSRLAAATGRADFNANSGDQVADYLFGDLGLEEIRMTSSGRGSTNDKILEALENEHPELPTAWTHWETDKKTGLIVPKHLTVIGAIRYFRETYKLKNTFVDRVPDFVHRWPFDGRVHTTLRTTSVVTGRLAASDPNVLAQPEHGRWAPDFKRGWVAEPGHVLWAGDQSQVELRGLAHLSQDPLLLAIFRGEKRNPDGSLIDIHAATAERIFGVKPAQQDKHKHRLPAKAVNFGIPMGMTCMGLSVELRKNGVDADEDTAQRWLDETLGLYPGVLQYMDARIAEARRHGFIRCLSGRIRYIGGINSRDERVRAEAERFAFSTPIQESATFIMKQGEVNVWSLLQDFWKRGQWVEPLIQIHDCLKLECDEKLAQELNARMLTAMTTVPKSFSVPLIVESERGYNMADMEEFDQ